MPHSKLTAYNAVHGTRGLSIAFVVALSTGLTFVGAIAQDVDKTSAALARLFDSPGHSLPVMPVAIPQVVTDQDVDSLLAPGNRPTVFQISNANGPDADPIKVLFFQEVATEYLNAVNFRKIAADSPAARHLHGSVVTKPVYVIADPGKTGVDRFLQLDETHYYEDARRRLGEEGTKDPANWAVTQRTLEGGIHQWLGVNPQPYAPFALTKENVQQVVFDTQPQSHEPTAKWVSVYFYPGDPKWAGEVNRIRSMLWMESFFFPGRVRELEANLSTEGSVYQTLIGTPPPDTPELWLINPDKRQGVKYTPGQDGPPLAELTHAAYVQWLAKNGLGGPGNVAINSEAIAAELRALGEQHAGQTRQ